MNKLIISILALIVFVVVGAAVWFFVFAPKQPSAPPPSSSTTLPLSSSAPYVPAAGSTPGATGVSGTSKTVTIGALGGGTMMANNFISNGITLSDAANKGRYLLAGNLGYCITDVEKCQTGTMTDFNIFFDSADSSFTIALLKEPLGQVRLVMEQFLMNTLGISQQDMCRLNYYVGTTSNVNTPYSTKNLGFSFCPGATVLPK